MNGLTQADIADLRKRRWPVIIVGAGPAGSLCALTLARAGVEVLVLDKFRFPRHKTCGDQLLPEALKTLEQVDLLDQVRQEAIELEGIRVFSPSRIDFVVPGKYLGIRRHDFDDILIRAAMEAGATFAKGKVTGIKPDATGEADVTVEGTRKPLRARVVVLATGASIRLAEKLGMIERRLPSAVAVRFYVESSYRLPESILSYDRSLLPGYAWIFPAAKDLFNIGCGIRMGPSGGSPADLRARLNRFLREFPIGTRIIERRWHASKITGAPLRCGMDGCKSLVEANVIAIGEVIGTTYPFTGEGIGMAMRSGLLAAEAIGAVLSSGDSNRLIQFVTAVENGIRPQFDGYLAAEKWLQNPRLNDFVARRLRRSRFLRNELAAYIAETGDPRRLFSWKSLFRSYFG